jgi:hypothetical protein
MRATAAFAAIAALLLPLGGGEARFAEWTTPALTRFESSVALNDYLADLRAEARARGVYWAQTEEERAGTIVLGGSPAPERAYAENGDPAEVDHGRRAAQIGRFILVLEDNRLFSIDTGAEGGERLALADRIDVHPHAPRGWHVSEMLVRGTRVYVTGHSRDRFNVEVLELLGDGRLDRSGGIEIAVPADYYNVDYWDAALSGDKLVLYAPISLSEVGVGEALRFASVRGPAGANRPLLGTAEVYRPLVRSLVPTLHSVTVCDLATLERGSPSCRSNGFVAPRGAIAYLDGSDAYLWSGSGYFDEQEDSEADCPASDQPQLDEVPPETIYRLPLGGAEPSVLAVRGFAHSFSYVRVADGQLQALLGWFAPRCRQQFAETSHLAFAAVPLTAFGPERREPAPSVYTRLPTMPRNVVARFAGRHLAVAAQREYVDDDDDGENIPVASQLLLVPVAAPASFRQIAPGHSVSRIEPLGDDLLLTGYRPDRAGMAVSLVTLAGTPRIASTLLLPRRDEGPRHWGEPWRIAAGVGREGPTMIGIPALPADWSDQRPIPRFADMELVAITGGRLVAAGALESTAPNFDHDDRGADGERDADVVPGYRCLTECYVWSGRARAFFIGGRVFALSGFELIEGRVEGGRVVEGRRLNYAAAAPPRRR